MEQKMNNIKCILVVALLFVLLLSGCGTMPAEGTTASTPAEVTTEPTTQPPAETIPEETGPAPTIPALSDMNFYPKDYFVIDDETPLEEALTVAYPLAELEAFFRPQENNMRPGEVVPFAEIQERFPIEVFRSPGYSVYKVEEGGYFYVDWNWDAFACGGEGPHFYEEEEPRVFFCAYINGNRDPGELEALMENKMERPPDWDASSYLDVLTIDPYAEMLCKNGNFYDYTVTYLNPEELLVLYYQPFELEEGYTYYAFYHSNEVGRYVSGEGYGVHFLMFTDILSRDINYLGTIYARILPQDLPQ